MTTEQTNPAAGRQRRTLLLRLAAFFLLAGLVWAAWWALVARHREATDDAYVGGNIVQVTPQVSGTVVAIDADETGLAREGAPLVRLDDSDARLALEHAQAELAGQLRQASQLFERAAQLEAQVASRAAELARARDDLARRQAALTERSVAEEEVQHAAYAVKLTEAGLTAARRESAAAESVVQGLSPARHPAVERAKSRLREAYLAWQRTTIPAPVSGYVAKRSVQVGQRVGPGAALMAVVPLDALWVDANFKEDQLARMRLGQPVALHADLYGDAVRYHGRLAGIGAGTGSAFALLPPQNATGNWIKVVQRIPVRVTLDPAELARHPLRVGLSMRVEVDVRDDSGPVLAATPAAAPLFATRVFQLSGAEAERLIESIVRANLDPAAR